jgi:YggT family protein
MFIFSHFLEGIARVLDAVLTLYMFIVIAHAILSWVNPDPYNPIVRFIRQMVDPLLFQIRKRIPTVFGGIDISPIIILLGIIFLQSFLVASLKPLAMIIV